jgi:uncharacterized repeat protein (TIGR03803 family)
VLYGTTYSGGAYSDGTVFSTTTAGAEKVLYSFQGGNDGANPSAALLNVKGALYGTTEYGGIPSYGGCNAGTVFSVNTSGIESIVYRFYGYNCHGIIYEDGGNPLASLISVRGKLYGTTSTGGFDEFFGTGFEVTTKGKETVLHSFEVHTDGGTPSASLVDVKGVLYGTTLYGGGNSSTSDFCCGIIFSMSKTGALNRLYVFDGPNGANPAAALIKVNGTLYGTTSNGGAYGGSFGAGTAFSFTTSGSLTTIHSFGSVTDGRSPDASLLNVGGALYGTTAAGGQYGKGTIFKMTLTGKEKVLHSFGHGSDGATPLAGLVDVQGRLYGTTSAGGRNDDGTIFALQIRP